jgi:hypothetical protein
VDGEVLRAWRRSRGWDAPEMARRLRRAATDGHVPAVASLTRMVRRWEREGLRGERYELLYARAVGVSPDDLAAGPLPSPVLSLSSADDRGDGDGPVNRREFGITAFGMLAGNLLAPARVPASLSAEHVRGLWEAAAGLWVRDWQVGAAALREASGYYAAARAMLDTSSYPTEIGRDLLAVTAELAACAGFLAFDAAEQQTARGLLMESAMLASSAGEPVMVAHAYSLLALQSSSLAASDRQVALSRESLRFLGLAADAARHVPSPRVHATIAMRRATASALLGDEREVRRHIAAAHRELDGGDHPSDPDWAGFVTPAEVTAHEAMARLSLGQPDKAAGVFRAVLAHDGVPDRNRFYYQARLAGALSAAGDREGALNEGMQVLSGLEGPVRSTRTANWLRPIRQSVPGDSDFAVRFDAVAAS